ncbi:Endonuclease MutS2 [Paramicrosporidium saccamoebae]|uniref:Endonuclease MutS2 n=1 Tax=Paramicrosporidium saccamoebae TaxID=1246581 RepID=A0A2H9TI79_9FUNG|nr:Endonuclease MutS2 [Paramicrosporidium saccamoebae]
MKVSKSGWKNDANRARGSPPPLQRSLNKFLIPHLDTSTPRHLDTSTPQHLNTSTPQHLNTSTPQHLNAGRYSGLGSTDPG